MKKKKLVLKNRRINMMYKSTYKLIQNFGKLDINFYIIYY